MAKNKPRIRSRADLRPDSIIKSHSNVEMLNKLLRFSFKYYDNRDSNFSCKGRQAEYFTKLLDRIRDLSRTPVTELTARKASSAIRFHQIEFGDAKVSRDSFGIPGGDDFDDNAWQFAISSNEHGRVHGFILNDVFYVVWLDPDHALYPGIG